MRKMKAINFTPEAVRLSSQQQLTSLQAAVDSASKGGVPYGKVINVEGWELNIFTAEGVGRATGFDSRAV